MKSAPFKLALAAAFLTLPSGCYSLAVNAHGLDKPVSMSARLPGGEDIPVLRHFKHDMILWYGAGLVPLAALPGELPALTPADKVVATLLSRELSYGGDGIVNLKVTQQVSFWSLLASLVPNAVVGGLLSGIPAVSAVGVAAVGYGLQPMAIGIEGDIVSKSGTGLRPGELDLASRKLLRQLKVTKS